MLTLFIIAYLIVGFFSVRWFLRKSKDEGTSLGEIIILSILFPLVLFVMLLNYLDEKIIKF